MFDDLRKQLRKIESTGVSVPIRSDAEGYLDKECPNKECLFQFKVFAEDWKNLCKDEGIHCPLCGHQAPSKSWWTKEQIEEARAQALKVVNAAVSRGLAEDARSFNRRQKPGLIKMSMSYSGRRKYYAIVPVAAQDGMKLKIICENCSTRFAVIGSAFFCPCCGYNSVERTFDDSLKKVEAKLNNLEVVRSTLESSVDKDSAELTCRSLVETGLNDGVVAFQKLMESTYLRISGTSKPPMNTFQRLDEGSRLWRQACGEGYEEWISKEDLNNLNILFHKRHLLAHTEGFVDDRYLQKTGDNTYKVGQRIVVKERDVRLLVKIVKLLAQKARTKSNP